MQKFLGDSGYALKGEAKVRDGILFICESIGSFNLASRIVAGFKFECKIYLYLPKHLYESNYSNAVHFDFYTSDLYAIPGLLQHIKLVVFGAHESTPYCRASIAIGYLAKQTETAYVSLQHGWIQPGLNFQTDLRRIGFSGIGSDNSRSLYRFSKILTFFGANGIGYPAPLEEQSEIKEVGSRCVVATNFNWGVYSQNEIISFGKTIEAVRNAFPDASIVHRPHPAERSQGISSNFLRLVQKFGVSDCAELPASIDLGWPNLVITTPSTIALDYICIGIPTAIYCPEKFENHIADLKLNRISFKDFDSLQELLVCDNLVSGVSLPLFPNKSFKDFIDSLECRKNNYSLSEEVFIRYCEMVIAKI